MLPFIPFVLFINLMIHGFETLKLKYRTLPNNRNLFLINNRLFLSLLLFTTAPISIFSQADKPNLEKSDNQTDLEITLYTEGPVPEKPQAGKIFEWRIIIRWFGDLESIAPTIKKAPVFQGAKLLSSSTTLKTGAIEDRRDAEKIFTYRLRTKQEGEVTVSSAAISYKETEDESETSFLNTDRTTIEVLPAPFSFRSFLQETWENRILRVIGIIVVVLVVTGVTLLWSIRFRHKFQNELVEEDKKKPFEDSFEAARRSRVEGDFKDYIRNLEQGVLFSFKEKYPEETSNNISSFANKIKSEQQPVLKRFVESCKETKFSPVPPSPDVLDQIWNDAKRLAE